MTPSTLFMWAVAISGALVILALAVYIAVAVVITARRQISARPKGWDASRPKTWLIEPSDAPPGDDAGGART